MRFRYEFEDGKHLVKTRDDSGAWKETHAYDSQEAAQAVVAKGEELQASTVADVEKALAGPKGMAQPKAPVKREGATNNVPDIDKDAAPPKLPKEAREDLSDVDPHDFTVIPGIGAATAEKLHGGGVKTLRMLARVSASRAEELGIREEWIARAKELTDV